MHDNHIAIDCRGIIMRVAIIGDGAMGTLFGALLSQGNEVSVLSRSAERSAAHGVHGYGRRYAATRTCHSPGARKSGWSWTRAV